MTLAVPGVSAVYANWGRWVADCAWCDSAEQLVPFTAGFRCVDCGWSTDVVWPPPDMVAGIERLLLMRPNRKNQNWLPTETLEDLVAENVTHGIVALHAGDASGPLLGTCGGKITTDALQTLNPRRELT